METRNELTRTIETGAADEIIRKLHSLENIILCIALASEDVDLNDFPDTLSYVGDQLTLVRRELETELH